MAQWELSNPLQDKSWVCWVQPRAKARCPTGGRRSRPGAGPLGGQRQVGNRDRVVQARDLILTGLLAGLRAEELLRADVGDIRTTDDGAGVIHVKGKGGKERSVPIETELLSVIEAYLDSRAIRFPGTGKRKTTSLASALSQWPARAPLFVGRDGERISRGTLQSRIKRAFKRAGPDAQPVPGALVHGLRHTYATELASSEVSVYTLMKLLGHESMTTSQRYVSAAGTETRSAAARNPIYAMITTGG